jgi:hypothetical protein
VTAERRRTSRGRPGRGSRSAASAAQSPARPTVDLVRRRAERHVVASAIAMLLAPAAVSAQDSTLASCEGLVVTAVDVEPEPPRIVGCDAPWLWRAVGRVLLQQRTTRPNVVRDFLRLEPGDRCSERARAESERVLRAQPFVADAEVRAEPDGAGGVRLVARTEDEIPVVIGGRVSGDRLTGVTFGNSNALGQGRLVVASWRDGDAFRDGVGLRLADYHAFGGPNVAALRLERAPLGHDVDASLTHPFYTPLQRSAWTAAYRTQESHDEFRRVGAEPISLPARRERWSAGGVVRLGGPGAGVFGGALAFGDRVERIGEPVLVTDRGLVEADDRLLAERFGTVGRTHVAGVVGLSALSFLQVQGFDALLGSQDVGRGIQLEAAADPGIGDGQFYSGDLYAGTGTRHWFVGARVEAEGRRPDDAEGWRDVVAGGRLAWYVKPGPTRTVVTSLEYGGTWRARLPYQVTLAERRGGLRGYRDTDYAGARRAVLRGEYRRAVASVPRLATLGLAGFAEGAKLWAGDAPYGVTTNTKGSLGLGLLVAAPQQSRRMVRADVAYPLVRGGGAAWEVRVTATSVARGFWREPGDVTRMRASALSSSLFNWP